MWLSIARSILPVSGRGKGRIPKALKGCRPQGLEKDDLHNSKTILKTRKIFYLFQTSDANFFSILIFSFVLLSIWSLMFSKFLTKNSRRRKYASSLYMATFMLFDQENTHYCLQLRMLCINNNNSTNHLLLQLQIEILNLWII